MKKDDKLKKPVATATSYQAIDYTTIYEIRILRPLKTGELLTFDTETSLKGLIYKKGEV